MHTCPIVFIIFTELLNFPRTYSMGIKTGTKGTQSGLPAVIFGRLYVKRFALCYRTVVCPVCLVCPVLSVTGVGVLWPNGWMDGNETCHGGRPRPRPHCALWGPSYHRQEKRGTALPQFSAHVCCGQTAGWIKMPLGTEIDLGQATL